LGNNIKGEFMNKKLLTLAVITSMSLASTVILHADNHSKKIDRTEHAQMDKGSFAGLNLSEEQNLQIAAIDETYSPQFAILQEQVNALKEQYKNLDSSSPDYAQALEVLDAEKVRLMDEKETLKAQHHEEVFAVLSEEQKAEMDAK